MSAPCPACREGRPSFACKALLYAGCEREIWRCAACGSASFHPMPAASDIARCYPPVYFRDFLRQYWKDVYKGRALARRLAPWRREGDFLDVGCALGTMLAGVRDHSSWRVKGLEFSQVACALGRQLNGVDIAGGELVQAPWPDGSFDFVHINNVLEHESDPEAALRKAAALLRPGGRLELTVPNGPVDVRPNLDLYRRWGRAVVTRHGGHLYFFSRKGLEAMLSRCGFDVLSLRSFHFKQGAKARGWLPGSYKLFARSLGQDGAAPAPEVLDVEKARAAVPERPSWPAYWLRYRLRRLWRSGTSDFGYDFEVLAEKRRVS